MVMRFNLKSLFAILVVLAMVLSFAACGNNGSSAVTSTASTVKSDTQDTTQAVKKEVKTFSVATETEKNTPGWQAVLKNIDENADKLGYKFEQEVLAGGDQFQAAMKARFAAGEAPDFIFVNGANLAGTLYGAKYFEDISGDWAKNFDADTLNSPVYTLDGKLICMPVGSINPGVVYYNKKVFAEAGANIPKNWNEMLQVCEQIKAKGKVPFFVSGKDAWSIQLVPIIGWHRALKGKDGVAIAKQLNENKLKLADFPEFKDALAKYKELKDKGYINETFVSDTYDMAKKAIADGTAGMYPMGAWVSSDFIKLFPDKVDDIGCFALDMDGGDMVPVWSSYGLSVTTACKDVELAKQAINYIGSKDMLTLYFKAEPGIPLAKGITVEGLKPFQQDIVNANNASGALEMQFRMTYWSPNIQNFMMDYLVGAKTVDEVLQAADGEIAKDAQAKNDPNWK
jgi:raffinose/stachyose/melibiose transport system substrate-binding protein